MSDLDNNIKLWNINNYECLIDIKNINKKGWMYSACFLKENNKNYIITSNYNSSDCEFIKVFDFNGNKKEWIFSACFLKENNKKLYYYK